MSATNFELLDGDLWERAADSESYFSLRDAREPSFAPNVIVTEGGSTGQFGTTIARRRNEKEMWRWSVGIAAGVEVLQLAFENEDRALVLSASVHDYGDVLVDFLGALGQSVAVPESAKTSAERSSAQVLTARPGVLKAFHARLDGSESVISHLDGVEALRAPDRGLPSLLAKFGSEPDSDRPPSNDSLGSSALEICMRSSDHDGQCLSITWASGETHKGGLLLSWLDEYALFDLEGSSEGWGSKAVVDSLATPAEVDPGLFWATRISPRLEPVSIT